LTGFKNTIPFQKEKYSPSFCLKRTKGKHSIEKPQKYSSKSTNKGKKKTVKSQKEHFAERGEENNKISHFTRKVAHACI